MKIGITGGIGSGKSYVCQRLQALTGIEVFDCDSEAKRLMRTSAQLRQQLTALIGPDTYTAEGQLNKAVVARYLLASEAHAKAVDNIVHPAVFDAFRNSNCQWMESAILYESGAVKLVDKVVCVVAPLEVRIARVMERDNISREKVEEWMKHQLPQDEVAAKAHFIVVNDGVTDIDKQIIKIIQQCNKQF